MLLQDKRIAIVGGGPGGLTLARLLQLKGAEVKVYERDLNKDVRQQGATLDLHDESGLKALAAAGLMDAFKENFRPGADKMRIVDQQATIFFDDHITKPEEDFGNEHFRPEIDRGPLRNILLGSLEPGTVIWDSQFQTMSPVGERWQLVFKKDTTAMADIVIGADGANSRIRPFITSIQPFYTGVTAVEGNVYDSATRVPRIHELLKGGKIFAFGGGKLLVVSAKGDGSLTFYPSFRTEEDWAKNSAIDFTDKAQVLAWFQQDFAEWDSVWHGLFENASSYFIPRPIYSVPLDQSWDALPDLTLLGDAAHLMTPYAGEGVNMAMLDALELCECLTSDSFKDLRSAITAYETQMRSRSSVAVHESLENANWMHAEGAMDKMLEMFIP